MKLAFCFLVTLSLLAPSAFGQAFKSLQDEKPLIDDVNATGQSLRLLQEKLAAEGKRLHGKLPERVGTESKSDQLARAPESIIRSMQMINAANQSVNLAQDKLIVIGNVLALALRANQSSAEGNAVAIAWTSGEICRATGITASALDELVRTNTARKKANEDLANYFKIPASTLDLFVNALNAEIAVVEKLSNLCARMQKQGNWAFAS